MASPSLRLMVVFARRKAAFRDLRNWVWVFYRKGVATTTANKKCNQIVGRLEREFDPERRWMLTELQELVKVWRAIDRNEWSS